MNEKLKKMFAPPEKVQKMYEAISELVQEKKEISALKVQEITSKAGIGKGTAYEYFSSKEEIILYASLWICFQQTRKLAGELKRFADFQSKFMFLMEWMEEYKEQNELIGKALKGSLPGECEKIKELLPEGLTETAKAYVTEQINELFDLGYQEGIINQQDVEKRMIVFWGAMMQYGFVFADQGKVPLSGMSKKEHKQFIYECMIKSLN